MTGGEVAALIGAAAALLTAAGSFLALVGHLINHKNQAAAQDQAPAPGNRLPPHP